MQLGLINKLGSSSLQGALLNYWWLLFSEPSDGDQVVFEAEEGDIIFEIETEDR